MEKAKIWLIWLAVMWANLARNIADKWQKIVVYNRTSEVTQKFLENYKNENLVWANSLEELVESLESPKKIIIMVKAGKPVDDLIEKLIPLLNKWDIIIDCWNSFYKDTQRRYNELNEKWLNFVWCGVSGWEEWALKWPSIMPGCNKNIYPEIQEIVESISAKDFGVWKCVTHIWENWSWHYVKMVHNGIEYAVMQMIAEAYDSLRKIYKLDSWEISEIFKKYNDWKLNSYLFEITSNVLAKKDEFDDKNYLVDKIMDKAWAKWTWLWTSIDWLNRAESVSTIIEATFSRVISSQKDLREKLSKKYTFKTNWDNLLLEQYIKILENTLYTGMLFAYAQWYALIMRTSKEESWDINLSEVSRIWQGWCIIRAKILDFLTKTFLKNQNFEHLFELDEIQNEIMNSLEDYKKFINLTLNNNIPSPSLSAWINYFYSITSEKSSANLIQWLRDYFWAHTYERTDRDWIFHTNW